jgi:response regulator NasT
VASRSPHLRVLIANESEERAQALTGTVTALGHEEVVTVTDVAAVAELTAAVAPDVALVGIGGDPDHALGLIDRLVREAACPVIALLAIEDRAFVNEAAKRGVFAYVVDNGVAELQSSLDIVLRRFAEYQELEGAFGRRAVTERAKGILMERHQIDEQQAFAMLRDHARRHRQRLVDVAQAVCDSRSLLPGGSGAAEG